ncbi:MAG TPA: glycosyltransferase [Anaerolineales bacterium]
MPVSILFTIPNFITAGSGRAMLNIVERLDRSRFSPAVAVLKKGGKLDAEVERLGIPLIEAPFVISARPYATLFFRAWKAAQAFRPYNFTLWHSFHYAEDYTEPLIAYFSGSRAWIYSKKNMNWHSRAWILRSLLARRIVAQNTDMLACFFHSPVFKTKTRLIPRGVDTQKFNPQVPPRLQLRKQYNIPADSPLITCVAELLPVKGHLTLIEAVAGIPNIHLLLAGRPMDANYAESLKQQAAGLGIATRAHFLGGVEDVTALLAESDIFVLPTLGRGRMEGCPVALLEAMACGKACVATDIPGSHDLIEHGKSGLLVPPEDPQKMMDALGQLLADPAQRLEYRNTARCRVEARYMIEREVLDHHKLYLEIIDTGAKQG